MYRNGTMFDDREAVVESPVQEVEETQVEETAVEETENEAPVVAQESPANKNFRMLREKAERIERERDEAMQRLRELENARKAAADEEDSSMDPDSLIEGKHLNKTHKKIKKLEEELRLYQQKNAEILTETRIKSQFPDFDSVVTKDNIASLKQQYPELAKTLNSTNDLYTTAVSAYTLIRKLGIIADDAYVNDQVVVRKNNAKPRMTASISPQQGNSPLTQANAFANGLTKDLKEQLYREMVEAAKNA